MNGILEEKIKEVALTKTNKRIAQFIIDNQNEVPFMTTTDIARAVDVSDASVLRFARGLGYENFGDFRKFLQENIVSQVENNKNGVLSPVEEYLKNESSTGCTESRLQKYIAGVYEDIRHFLEKNPEERFDLSADMLVNSRKKYVMGFREAAGAAQQLGEYMGGIMEDVILNTEIDYRGMTKLLDINEKDSLVIFGFKRYADPALDFLDFAKERRARIITVTDQETSPFALQADCAFICQKTSSNFFGSNITSVMVSEILLSKIGERKKEALEGRWRTLDDYLKKYHIY